MADLDPSDIKDPDDEDEDEDEKEDKLPPAEEAEPEEEKEPDLAAAVEALTVAVAELARVSGSHPAVIQALEGARIALRK